MVHPEGLVDAVFKKDDVDPETYQEQVDEKRVLYRKFVLLLLKNGADINKTDQDGKSCIISALEARNFEAVRLMLEQDELNLNLINKNGGTVIHSFSRALNSRFSVELFRQIIDRLQNHKEVINKCNDDGFNSIQRPKDEN